MTATITFRPCRSGGREIACLGDVEVGFVLSEDNQGRRQRARWLCVLPPNGFNQWRGAADLADAKRAVIFRVADWLDCAGLDGPPNELRSQADDIVRARVA